MYGIKISTRIWRKCNHFIFLKKVHNYFKKINQQKKQVEASTSGAPRLIPRRQSRRPHRRWRRQHRAGVAASTVSHPSTSACIRDPSLHVTFPLFRS